MSIAPPDSPDKRIGRPPRKQISHLSYFLLPVVIIIPASLFFIDIRMPEQPSDKGEGNIYFKQSAASYHAAREYSPLPMKLPAHMEPAHLESMYSELLEINHENQIRKAPVISPFDAPEGSVFLDREKLLKLPPVNSN